MITKWKKTEVGEIPEEWELLSVKDVGKVITGKTPSTKHIEYFGKEYPFIKIPDLNDSIYIEHSEAMLSDEGAEIMNGLMLPPDSVMVSCLATIGKVGITRRCSFTNQQINSIIPKTAVVSPEWIYYYWKSKTQYLESLGGGGSVYTNISKSKFENAKIIIPTIPEQHNITKILLSLDSTIELNQQMNQTLEAIGQAIFRHWFVDFEFPDEKGRPYRSSGGKMVKSELGMIPEGWEVKSLTDAAEFLNGLALQNYPPEGTNYLPVIKIGELHRGINESSNKASAEIDARYIVSDGDLLFSWSGSLTVVIWCGGNGALNQHLFKVNSMYPKWLVYEWIKYHLPYFQRTAASKATTMGHIQRHHLEEAKVLIPKSNTLQQMDGIMSQLLEDFISNNIEIRELAVTRDSLLPKLMSGKIRVPIGVAK